MNTPSAWRPAKARPAADVPGLIKHRRALARRLAKKDSGNRIVPALVADRMHLRRIGVSAGRAIVNDGVVLPATLPELVDDLHELFGDGVALVMGYLIVAAEVARSAVERRSDDVPADPAVGQMVQGRHLTRKQTRQFVQRSDGDTETKMLSRRRHGGDGEQRIVGRRLQSLAEGLVGAAAIDVEDAESVGDEQAVEFPALKRLCELDPKGQFFVAVRLAVRVPPQARRRVGNGGAFETVEAYTAITCHSNSQRAAHFEGPAQPVSIGSVSSGAHSCSEPS
jgi:hypothetical protein